MKRRSILGVLLGVVLVAAQAASVGATTESFPTGIGVTPTSQISDGCPSATASWTVSLVGGNSGPWTVDVDHGDGYGSPLTQTYLTSIPWSYTFYDPYCQHHDYQQYWTASRAGGGTGHDYSHVVSN